MGDFNEISLNAPSLGADIVGLLDTENNIVLFRGIPFATVEKRWTHSVPKHSLDPYFDARRLGYRCSQLTGLVLVSGGTDDPTPGDDEFKCLNLNIAIPKEATGPGASKLLPVMVWIHGYDLGVC
jgi:carboxylesterase type B